jgi:hypothetical protein
MKTSRDEVYAAIDGERDYQDTELGVGENSVPGEILILESYIARARASWVDDYNSRAPALRMIRKVAGIAVRCMENHGAPKR